MKRYLGQVVNNQDPDKQKRIQAQIIGLTEGVPDTDLPWCLSIEGQTLIPPKGDAVWIYVERLQDSEDYDYQRMWYEWYQTTMPKEAYDYVNSTSYKNRKMQKSLPLSKEPADVTSVEYPKNRVITYSGITLEFDEGNKRLCITDAKGNYIMLTDDGIKIKSLADEYQGTVGVKTIETTNGTEILATTSLAPALAGQPMILGDFLKQYLLAIEGYITAHVHTSPFLGLPTTPPTIPPTAVSINTVPGVFSLKNKVN